MPSILCGVKGVLQVRDHCIFEWWQDLSSGRGPIAWSSRRLRIEDHHCALCIREVRRVALRDGYELVDGRPPSQGWADAPTQPRIRLYPPR